MTEVEGIADLLAAETSAQHRQVLSPARPCNVAFSLIACLEAAAVELKPLQSGGLNFCACDNTSNTHNQLRRTEKLL